MKHIRLFLTAAAILASLAPSVARTGAEPVALSCRIPTEDLDAVEAFAFAALADGFLVADLAAGKVAFYAADGQPAGVLAAPGLLAACADPAGATLLLFPGAVCRHASAADACAGKVGRRTQLAGFRGELSPRRYRLAASPDGAFYVHDREARMHHVFDAAGRPVGRFPGDGPVLPLSALRCLDAPCDPDEGLVVTELLVATPAAEAEQPDTLHLRTGLRNTPGAAPVALGADRRSAWVLAPSPVDEGQPAVRLLKAGPGGVAAAATLPFAPLEGFFTVRGKGLWLGVPTVAEAGSAMLRVHAIPLDR